MLEFGSIFQIFLSNSDFNCLWLNKNGSFVFLVKTEWIQDHHTIQLMSGDGSTTYQKAIVAVERLIVQVMYLFHLLFNL